MFGIAPLSVIELSDSYMYVLCIKYFWLKFE